LSSISSYTGGITVQMVDRKERSRSVWQVTDQVRKYLKDALPTAIVQVSETQSSVAGVSGGAGGSGGPNTAPVQIELQGKTVDTLAKASYRMQEILAKVPGIKDIRSSYTEGMPEIRLYVDRDKLKFYNTTVDAVNNVFNSAIAGGLAGYYANDPNNDGQDTDIYVRLKGSDGYKASDIRSIPVLTSNNYLVKLGDVARIEDGLGPVMLRRVDKQESINISANITDRPLQEVLTEIKKNINPSDLGTGVTYQFTGQATTMSDTFGEMAQALGLSLILVYMLLAVLYESVSTPIIRMFSLPLGIIGSLVFLVITHNTINLYSLIGFLVMDGLVAKNGTLLLDYTLTLMEGGMNARDAIIEAGKTRLKPIFMTTLTMIVGMMPTALALSAGSETRVSMAWVLVGGLLSSTFFTLIITPIAFLFFDKHPMRTWFNVLGWLRWTKAKFSK